MTTKLGFVDKDRPIRRLDQVTDLDALVEQFRVIRARKRQVMGCSSYSIDSTSH